MDIEATIKRFMVGEYIGDILPKWCVEGVRLRVKSTPVTRKHGLKATLQTYAWPGEVGTVVARQGNGWHDLTIEFATGARFVLTTRLLEDLVKMKG